MKMARRDEYIHHTEPTHYCFNNCNVMIGTNNTIKYYNTCVTDSDDSFDLEEDGIKPAKTFPLSDNGTTFIGRKREMEEIKTFLYSTYHKILQIFGPAFVGKKTLAKKAVYGFSNGNGRPIFLIPCNQMTSWSEFINLFAQVSKLNIQVLNITELSYIVSFRDRIDKHRPVILFTNCERLNLTKTNCSRRIKDFLMQLADMCSQTKIIITSQQQIDFGFEKLSLDIKLSELSSSESLSLFDELLPEQDTEMYKDVILERCHGLPTFVLDAASLIRDNQDTAPLTNDDLRDLLQDDVRLTRIQDDPNATSNMVLGKYIPSVPPDLQQTVTDLSILLDGQFGLEAVEAVLGKSAPEAKHAVGVLCKNFVLSPVGNTTLYHFSPRIGETLGSIMKKHIPYSDAARLRFVKYFGGILLKTNSDLYLPSQQSLYGYDEKSWTHLQTVLCQAIHCTDSTFDAFKQVALKADNIIINCFPRESVEFYEQLTDIAQRCGSSRDVAALKAQLARALTVNKGTNLKHALKLFQEAEEVLKVYGASSALICLMRDMAFNYFKDANYTEAARCCEEGIRYAQEVETDNMDISRILSTRSLAAINYNILGDSEKAEAIILDTLELANEFSTSHSSIYVMLNTLVIIHERFRKNDDEALRYFKASLHERRKYEQITPSELIVPLNSVGMLYSKREENEKALKYLEESLSICRRCSINDDKAGLTYMHLAIVNMKLTKYELACDQMQKAVQIYSVCSANQRVHINLRLCISHCLVLKEEFEKAKEFLKECFEYSKSLIEQAPKYDHYLAALAHLIILAQDNKILCEKTLKRFVEESSRLLDTWNDSDDRVEMTRSLLSSATQILENIAKGQRIDVTPFIDINKICFVCQNMIGSGVAIKQHWQIAESKKANSAAYKCRLFQL